MIGQCAYARPCMDARCFRGDEVCSGNQWPAAYMISCISMLFRGISSWALFLLLTPRTVAELETFVAWKPLFLS